MGAQRRPRDLVPGTSAEFVIIAQAPEVGGKLDWHREFFKRAVADFKGDLAGGLTRDVGWDTAKYTRGKVKQIAP